MLAEQGQLFLCFNGRGAKSCCWVFFIPLSFCEPSSFGQLVMLILQSPDLMQLRKSLCNRSPYCSLFTHSSPSLFLPIVQPLLPMEHNGPGLEYKVSYRRQDVEDEWKEHMVKRHSFVVKKTPTFVPYEIKIQAKNHQGWGPEPRVVSGYSGEDCEYLAVRLKSLIEHIMENPLQGAMRFVPCQCGFVVLLVCRIAFLQRLPFTCLHEADLLNL